MMVKRRMIILLSLVLLVTFIMATFLWSMRDDLPLEMSSNFGIVFTYGYQQAQGYSGLDTLQELISKDLVMDGVVETHCTLSKKALGEIYGHLRKVHITRYPSEYRSSLGDLFQFRVSPGASFGGTHSHLKWRCSPIESANHHA